MKFNVKDLKDKNRKIKIVITINSKYHLEQQFF